MAIENYVGITGPINIQEVKFIIEKSRKVGIYVGGTHKPMIGYLISDDTLDGKPSKVCPNRFVNPSKLPGILSETFSQAFHVVHYNNSDFDKISEGIIEFFRKLYEDDLKPGIQLNMPEPNPKGVHQFRKLFPESEIIFQLRPEIMKEKTPEEIARFLVPYGSSISYALIDPSCGGKYETMNPEVSSSIYQAIRNAIPTIGICVAGRLTGKNTEAMISPVIKSIGCRDFSIDAESGLRNQDDNLDHQKVNPYLESAAKVLLD